MKVLIYICVLSLVGFTLAGTKSHSRGCIYVNGRCYKECEEGTHAYTTGCGYLTPEATCENPTPEQETRGQICDFSACYCDSPTVRDTVSNTCVALDQCPAKSEMVEKPTPSDRV